MVNTHYAKFSHPDPPGEYQAYLHHVFKEVYGLSVDDAYWLAKAGDFHEGLSHDVDWLYCIEFIDAFLLVRGAVQTAIGAEKIQYNSAMKKRAQAQRRQNTPVPGQETGPANATPQWKTQPADWTAVNAQFENLTKHLEKLIASAKANPDWHATRQDLLTIRDLTKDIVTVMTRSKSKWTSQNSKDTPVFSHFQATPTNGVTIWPTAAFLHGQLKNRRGNPSSQRTARSQVAKPTKGNAS